MAEKRASIFISSRVDMREHRERVSRALRQRRHQVLLLEEHAAASSPIGESVRRLIESSDLFVAIIDRRYSEWVELEIRGAWEMGKPTLIFMTRDEPTLEDESGRLAALRAEIMDHVTVGFFRSPDDLVPMVVRAVEDWEQDLQNESAAPSQRAPLAIPSDVDALDLAFWLVLAGKAETGLLLHLDLGALAESVQNWARGNDAATASLPSVPYREVYLALKARYGERAPSQLWKAWMRTTRGHLFGGQSPDAGQGAPQP
jgi:hypothetical protein